ncbi:pectate lyase-like protein [Mycobacterium sp. BK558]|nr:pectate lyase-like protein [Mycobacterium sp. BK558]
MISRRTLLAGAAGTALLAAVIGSRRDGRVVDVSAFGARGDGVADDSAPIQAAVATVLSGSTLYFPRGTYRFARRWPSGGAAIALHGLSDVTVVFAPGAQLRMDNLDPINKTGTSHGLLVSGRSSRIRLRNVDIRWAPGAPRSLGDGIRVAGWPGRGPMVEDVTLSDCTVRNCPQAGVVMLGVSGISVSGLQVSESGADGLHFNACRRGRVDDYRAVDTGDDGLAFVTYFSPDFSHDDAAHTFSFPELTQWSNADFTVNGVTIDGGAANGLRIAGAHRVTVSGLTVDGVRSGSAVMVDSAEPGTHVGWTYLASQAIRINDVRAANCETGVHVLARPASTDDRFTEFGLHIGDARFEGCSNWAMQVESLTEKKVSGLSVEHCTASSSSITGGNGGIGLTNADDIALGTVAIRHREPVVTFSAVNAEHFAVDQLRVTIEEGSRPQGSARPAVKLARSHGAIRTADVAWPAAPDSWRAVETSDDSAISP